MGAIEGAKLASRVFKDYSAFEVTEESVCSSDKELLSPWRRSQSASVGETGILRSSDPFAQWNERNPEQGPGFLLLRSEAPRGVQESISLSLSSQWAN
jgi:hypothetical protein